MHITEFQLERRKFHKCSPPLPTPMNEQQLVYCWNTACLASIGEGYDCSLVGIN